MSINPRAAKIALVSRSKEESLKGKDRGRLIATFNEGHNVAMFPEGNVTDGMELKLFRDAMAEILYGMPGMDAKGNEVKLEKDVCVQPVAIDVIEVNGEDARTNKALRRHYSMFEENNTLSGCGSACMSTA